MSGSIKNFPSSGLVYLKLMGLEVLLLNVVIGILEAVKGFLLFDNVR